MKKIIKNNKFRIFLSVATHIIGAISFLLVMYALSTTWVDNTVSPVQVTHQMDSYPSKLPDNVVVKSTVQEIKEVPLYGYSYKVADNMYIVNFSRGDLKLGDTVKFRIRGAVKVGDAYLVNADYE